ncbi:MAG TPA: DUF4097 family beta strand repeat-containing protein [Candidatus Cloacimonadota bacterium]|nr:DUF4097 family beta strand repeat-containing protein [Candidatus Cloacimonadota bacterium]
MKQYEIKKEWAIVGLEQVVINNQLAPMSIDQTEGAAVKLEGKIFCDEPHEDFNWEDYVSGDISDEKLTIDLDEIEAMDRSGMKASQLRLSVPAGVFISYETYILPLGLNGLKNNLKVATENAPVSVNNCEGDLHIESENGPVRIHNSSGNIFAKLENGPMSAEAISGEGLHVESENGPIKLRLSSFTKVDLATENGPIYYETQPVEGGDFKLKTENGIIHLVLPIRFSFSLKAESEIGRIKSKLDFPVSVEDGVFGIENLYDDEVPTQIKIETENGMIKLSSDSHINLDYIKAKLNQLKEDLLKADTSEEKAQVTELLNKVVEYLNRAVKSINEDKIREKVELAIGKLKDMAQNIDFESARTVVVGNVEDISSQIFDGIKDGLKDVKSAFDGLKYEHMHGDSLRDYIHKVLESPHIKPYLGAELKKKEKDTIAEASRLKILSMLESGKITSEEAERLLKAIGKE